MQEDFLHYIWKHKKFDVLNLKTTKSIPISIISVGTHNHNSGPDFFNAQLRIGQQLWAGNVEIHINASDWFVHNHENDKAYDNVILHIVWEDDSTIFRKDNSQIPTLQLRDYISKDALKKYHNLFSKEQKWINCETDFNYVNDFVIKNWLERLYFERLERKSKEIQELLQNSQNNWEAVLFKMLMRAFGLKINSEAFLSVANSFNFTILRKVQTKHKSIEALLFGQSGLLKNDNQDSYLKALQNEYEFLKQKFKLSNDAIMPIQFFRLRPSNFPTIRLAQLANLYFETQSLFSKIISLKSMEEAYNLFSIKTSEYWDTHYTFEKTSINTKKQITKSFVDLVFINAIIPLKFSYAKHQEKSIDDVIVNLIRGISSEKNSIITKFNSFKKVSTSALESQALIQLKTNYCDKNKCLECAIGNTLLTGGY